MKQVFLGGSCNPTTWRKDIAIPILEAAKITYYNPQVDEWTPDLMQIEAHAKRDAEMLFYVVDANTRAVASMNEVVECICRNRKIVLVVQNMEASNELTRDEAGSEALLKDLNRGRDYLRYATRRIPAPRGAPARRKVVSHSVCPPPRPLAGILLAVMPCGATRPWKMGSKKSFVG